MIELIADRLFKNWKTTLVAFMVFGAIAYLGVEEIIAWDVLSGYATTAFTLLFVKDPDPKKKAPKVEPQ